MTRPRLLDLFCGAGGAAMGYHRAGFKVVGVDIAPQPHYPFEFHQADAMAFPLDGYDVIHASPPCQGYSVTASLHDSTHPQLVEEVRSLLRRSGLSYVIENVEGAPLLNFVRLCGSSFGLGVRRHRLFEMSHLPPYAPQCAHYLQPEPIDVTGTGGPAPRPKGQAGGAHRKPRDLAQARDAMGIDWMSRRELSQAIPPAYTTHIGAQLLAAIKLAGVA